MESINNMSIYERARLEEEKALDQSEVKQQTEQRLIDDLASATQYTFPNLSSMSNSTMVPQFIPVLSEGLKQSYLQAVEDNLSKGLRLQDSFLQEMSDQG